MTFIRNNRSSTVPGTIGDFIKALEIESILKYVKINHPIFGKKSRNVIKNDSKNTWKLINSLMSRNNKSNLIEEIKVDDQIISKNNKIAEAFNDYFINIGPKLASDVIINNNPQFL